MGGVYLLFLNLSEDVKVGALGEIRFDGKYVYVGSGQTNVGKRLERHFSVGKKKHWHIDYISGENCFDYFILPEKSSYECWMAKKLADYLETVEGFGCSDCNCKSHLFRVPTDFSDLEEQTNT